MLVKYSMSVDPVTVSQEATIAEAIHLMLDKHISGLPVVDKSGRLVGMLSEGDLLRRAETGTQKKRARWLEWLLNPGALATEYAHSHGRRVAELMTNGAFTVGEDTTLTDVVALMEKYHVKRLPVMRGQELVGIITRSDLIRALVPLVTQTYEDTMSTDGQIRNAIVAELKSQPWAPVASVEVTVKDGVVDLSGIIWDEREREALKVAAENVTGVKAVQDHLTWVEPYTGTTIASV